MKELIISMAIFDSNGTVITRGSLNMNPGGSPKFEQPHSEIILPKRR